MRISDFRFQISDFSGCFSQLRTPRSALRASSRSGITIIEVLFAILVTTVGLFGALAIFPVASAQARRARLNDMMAAAGRSAFHDFDTRGMRRPDRLLSWNPGTGAFVKVGSENNHQANESYCIDPRFIAANISAGVLPSTAWTFPSDNGSGDLARAIPLSGTPNLSTMFDTTLMRRITLRASNAGGYMTLAQANSIFVVPDDISYERSVKDKSAPAQQNSTSLGSAPVDAWGTRLADGKISWFATLVPQFDISGLASDQYTLSIVMLHERQNELGILDATKERIVAGLYLDPSAATGGEILLQAATAEHLKIRPNDWIMVSGTYSGPNVTVPLTRFQWYRVADCDAEPIQNATSGAYELYATLMGQDWNTSFFQPLPAWATGVAGATPVRVTIVEGAFAVYEKTVRLEYGSTF